MRDGGIARKIAVVSSVGLALVFSTLIGLGIGLMLDKWLGTKPIFMMVFLIIGIIAGFVNLFRTVLSEHDNNNGRA